MRAVFLMVFWIFLTKLMLVQLGMWKDVEVSVVQALQDDYELMFCARFASYKQNLAATLLYMGAESIDRPDEASIALAEQLFFEIEEEWKMRMTEQQTDCSRYSDEFEIYQQENLDLPRSYPNAVFRFQ